MSARMRPCVVIAAVLAIAASWLCVAAATPLDDYVKAPDDHYNYTLLTRTRRDNYTLHVLNMTSQKWMDDSYSNHPVWWHTVVIVVPDRVQINDTAFLLIEGMDNTDEILDDLDPWVEVTARIAVSTQTVTANVRQIPNQPIIFTSDPSRLERKEDELLGWTWREFMEDTSRPESLAHLAMTKAVVRAMDTVDGYSRDTRRVEIDKFFISGASKRGWTAWLTSAVDSRVVGMAPMVFDLLNMGEALHHQYQSLGGWSFAFQSFYDVNVTRRLDSDVFDQSADIIDPLVYKDRYKMPTYIIKATGDEILMLDETKFFYNQLSGPTYLRLLPNCPHNMGGQITNAVRGIWSFYLHVLHGATYPEIDWTMTSSNASGTIHVTMDRKPLSVTVYQANTLEDGRRDFRLLARNPISGRKMFHPVKWFKGHVTKLTPTKFEATVPRPASGWTGFFIEVTFRGLQGSVLAFSTEVNIVPDTLPFPDCTTNCTGTLV